MMNSNNDNMYAMSRSQNGFGHNVKENQDCFYWWAQVKPGTVNWIPAETTNNNQVVSLRYTTRLYNIYGEKVSTKTVLSSHQFFICINIMSMQTGW